ncbi:UDP-N-acetylglucosamine transferase subunit ALG14 homolog isoform X3 [Siniperca chuatsi]|uniref:UDP-N-acetylglucosamine transferase subunit ALG14 homolog isoform X3 n=1 Tax=Siniperca chuatsi TaxID=119488 RepID=UPI001CE0D352|nr:UDP-N-acetylglucosamine transferase subunit ALG14 homolog isoform X3 [Siniperca chuatsi]
MAFLEGAVFAVLFICLLFVIRLYIVVTTGSTHQPGIKGPVAVLVVAGSGGHTAEILRLMECLSAAYTPRHYVIADTDRMSEEKICNFESPKRLSNSVSQFTICRIPRSREVHQSWSFSVISTLNALWYSLPLVFRLRPDMTGAPSTSTSLKNNSTGIQGNKGVTVFISYYFSCCSW